MPNVKIYVVKKTKTMQPNFGASAKNQIVIVETGKTKDKITEALQLSGNAFLIVMLIVLQKTIKSEQNRNLKCSRRFWGWGLQNISSKNKERKGKNNNVWLVRKNPKQNLTRPITTFYT